MEVNLSSNRKCAEVSYIKSPNNFWVRLEEYKNDYTNMLKNLQSEYSNSDSSLNLKELTLGSYYCTFNEKLFEWQRCECLLINKSDVYISYMDIGQTDLVPIKSIKELKPEFKQIAPFALHCSLNSIKPVDSNPWSSSAIQIFSKLVEKKICTICIKSKKESLYHIDLYIKNLDISKELIKECVAVIDESQINENSKTPDLVIEPNIEYNVIVNCIYSPFCFYSQLESKMDEFLQFESSLQTFYNQNCCDTVVNRPQIGQLCIAKYTQDEQWYRARIKEIDYELNKVRVFFIDYGNEDFVSIGSDLLVIKDEFKNYPSMAVKCCLHGLKPASNFSPENLDQISDFMFDFLNGSVRCKFLDKKLHDSYLVELIVKKSDGVFNLAEVLLKEKFVEENKSDGYKVKRVKSDNKLNRASRTKSEQDLKPKMIRESELKLGQTFELLVTHIETLSEFYCKKVSEKNDLSLQLQYFYEKKINLPLPELEINNPCVYYDYDKKEYFRSKILHVYDESHCLIRLVDFGSTKYVNKSCLREIYEKFLEAESESVLACLDGVLESEEIDEQIENKFKEIALNKKFIGKCKNKINQKYTINLFDENDESVYSVLVHNLNTSVSNLEPSNNFKPVYRSKLEETQVSSIDLSLNETCIPIVCNYYKSLDFNLDLKNSYEITPSHFESLTSFYVQLGDLILNLDSRFDEFQAFCEKESRLTSTELSTTKNLNMLSIGAKFYEDNLWYRARIINREINNNDKKVLIEFIDYGNTQLTLLSDCVYLNKEFSEYPRSAYKCAGLCYMENINYENWLQYGSNEQKEDKITWKSSYFYKKETNLLIEISDLIKLVIQHGLLSPNLEPRLYNEKILNRIDLDIKNTGDLKEVRLSSIENGLKYIYFNLKQNKAELEQLEQELKHETDLVEAGQLEINKFYLISNKDTLYRSILISNSNEKIFFQIDYGNRVSVPLKQVFLMLPKYFKIEPLCFHCRLTLADNIEAVWTKDEKQKFFKQIQPGFEFKIKFLSLDEPYIIEFYDEKNSIDFQFNQIISRLQQTEPETRTLINGINSVSMNEVFTLAGEFLKLNILEKNQMIFYNQVEGLNVKKFFKFYLKSDKLNREFELFNKKLESVLNSSNLNELKPKLVKKGDLFLSKTCSEVFLNNLEATTKSLIGKHWSRVKVSAVFVDKKTNLKHLSLFYIDYGLIDTISYIESPNSEFLFDNYRLLQTPIHIKLTPAFVYETVLNKNTLSQKLNSLEKMNEFIDWNYLNDSFYSMFDSIKSRSYLADMSDLLLNSGANLSAYELNLVDSESKKSLVDLVAEYSLANITNYYFPCLISHVNCVKDFYVQKEDTENQKLLLQLQETIQEKVDMNRLNGLKSMETNKLCIAKYEQDNQYYRSKIIGFGNSNEKMNNFNQDLKLDIFYIDYGNTGQTSFSNTREISPDLTDRWPKSFAINTCLYLPNEMDKSDLDELDTFLFEIFESKKFLVKLKHRIGENKYFHTGLYQVELYEAETRKNFLDLVEIRVKNELNKLSNMSDSLEEDKAIAESLNDTEDETGNNTTNLFSNNKLAWDESVAESKLTSKKQAVMFNQNPSNTWEETALDLKNYESETLNETDVTLTEKSELYSTANSDSSRFDLDQSIADDLITIPNCYISYIFSDQDLFIQESNFDETINKIQPLIDQCLDEYNLKESKFCVGQYKLDGGYYRCKVLEWNAKRGEAFVQFIDYGNREWVSIDTITKLSDELLATKPLCFNCCLDLNLDPICYSKLVDLVNKDSEFDVKLIKNDLNEYYKEQNKPVRIELYLNGNKISRESLLDKELDSYYKINVSETSCQVENGFKSIKKEDNDDDGSEDSKNSHHIQFKTSTQINLPNQPSSTTTTATDSSQITQKEEPIDSDIINFIEAQEADLNKIPSKPEVYFYVSDKNETINNHNETVENFMDQSSVWDKDKQNLTVSEFADQDSRWSVTESTQNETLLANHNEDASRFLDENSRWSNGGGNKENTLDDSEINETKISNYLAKTINEPSMSMWVDDLNESGFGAKGEMVDYTRILSGNVIHVNSMQNFYFQAEDADIQLMNMKQLFDKCEKRFDKVPSIGQLCVTRYRVDEQFYRAQILEIIGNNSTQNLNQSINIKLKVLYIDYGNEDYVSLNDVYKITNELKYIAPLALRCSLYFPPKLQNIVQKMSSENLSELTRYFKSLTGKTKVLLKIRKQTDTNISLNMADVFLNNENVCSFLENLIEPGLNNVSLRIENKPKNFDCVVTGLAECFKLEVKLRNEKYLNEIDKLIEDFNNQTQNEVDTGNEFYSLAPIEFNLVQKFKLNNSLGRVKVLEKKQTNSKLMCRCLFVDFDYETWINSESLIKTNHLMSHLQSSIDQYELDLKNFKNLNQQNLTYLNNIFKLLINYEAETSSRLKAYVNSETNRVRLEDPSRDSLDLNTILEMCISLILEPFCGRIMYLETDYSQFDCLNDQANNKAYLAELNKIYQSVDLFEYSPEQDLELGALCLIDCSAMPVLRASDSIMSLAEHINECENDSNQKMFNRGIILDSDDLKCVVLNTDNGKRLTIKKTRLRVLNPNENKLICSLPCFLIRAKPYDEFINERILNKSRYYGDSIKLRIKGEKNGFKLVELLNCESKVLQVKTKENEIYYKLSHAKSLGCFFLHTSETDKQLKFIQEQIQSEGLKRLKNAPSKDHIYAVYNPKDSNFYRVKLLNPYVSTNSDECFQFFFIDYGFVGKARLTELICLSEQTQSIAPQAICCKLADVCLNQNKFSDAETSFMIENQNEQEMFENFRKILTQAQKFQVTTPKVFNTNEQCNSFIPLQSDNTKPIEILIHVNGKNLNELLKTRDEESLILKKLVLSKNIEYEVEMCNLESVNRFFLCLKRSRILLDNLEDKLKEFKFKNVLKEDLRKGLVCVYFNKSENMYRRCLIQELKSNSICVYLIDYGLSVIANSDCLYQLPKIFYDCEPLCFKCSLNIECFDKEDEFLLTQKLKQILPQLKMFKLRILSEILDEFGLSKYIVNLPGVNLNQEMDKEKSIVFTETVFPLNQVLKVQLTNIDTAKHFGLVMSAQNEKRLEFLNKFHQWHKENKKNLKLLIQSEASLTKNYLGQACAVSSVQIGKWCRGLIVKCDLVAQMSNVYLVDFCKTLTVTHDRLYKLENEEFLKELCYVHRCQLVDDQTQLEQFSKYIDLLKSSSSNLLAPSSRDDSLNNSHLSIESFEVIIECLGKELTQIHSDTSSIKNFQYKVKVNDIKRIKSPFPQSPHSILNNSSKIKITHQMVKYESYYDETTENILCSTYKENINREPKTLTITHEQIYENDYQNDTFSAITESTRIQTFNDTNTNNDLTLCESVQTRTKRNEETTNWIQDFEDNDESKIMISKAGLEIGQSVRVRVLPYGFTPSGFYCQRLDLLSSYERLQSAMNDYYQKIANASKSLEKDKSDPRFNSLRSDFTDSLEDVNKSVDNDLFTQMFHKGDYCAAYLGKTWSRYVILDIENKNAHIECVDDGRKNHVSIYKLEKLSDNFKVMPRFCFRCKFSGLDSKKLLSLDLKAIERFQNYLCENSKEFKADLLDVKKDQNGQDIFDINLYLNNASIMDLWIK